MVTQIVHGLVGAPCESFKGGSGWSIPALALKGGMDQWLLAVTSGSAARGLEIIDSGLFHCHFPSPSLSYHV